MLKKSYSKTDSVCRVTFKLPAEVNAERVNLIGDFNEWDAAAHSMKRLKDGSFSITISLKPEQSYCCFRYLLDGESASARWENDWEADSYQPNPYDATDSVVTV